MMAIYFTIKFDDDHDLSYTVWPSEYTSVYSAIFAQFNFRPSTIAKSFTPSWIRPEAIVFKER